MLDSIKKIYSSTELRNKILFVFFALFIVRILSHIPMPGVDLVSLKNLFSKNEAFGLLNLFTGGAMRNFSVAMMGVGPYITASIIFQLLTMIVPSLEALQKEGEHGKEKINHYTRLATVPLAFLQSYSMIILLKSQGISIQGGTFDLITMLFSLSAGTILVMWIGELISEKGIGNGISLIISLGIIANLPTGLAQTISTLDSTKIIGLVIFGALAVLVTAAIVYVNQGERQIPITYARRVRGMKSYGGVDTFLPLKVIMAGVIPIIFALSVMVVPNIVSKFLEHAKSPAIAHFAVWLSSAFSDRVIYGIVYFVLVLAFTFFYTSVIFQPKNVAENLQKRGGFIPGIRPGAETAQYISSILYKITFAGGIFLGLIAVLPYIVQSLTNLKTIVLGGTGILIVISVVLETKRQIESQLIMRKYDQY